jgi:hypothetical protein
VKKGDATDPKGLINDAYSIEGITAGECRSIFLDWALSVPQGVDMTALIGALLARHVAQGHPMTEVLREGLEKSGRTGRRGGRRARVGDQDPENA